MITDFEKIKPKQAFDNLRTDKLDKIAADLGETPTTRFDILVSKYEAETEQQYKIESRQIEIDLKPNLQRRITVMRRNTKSTTSSLAADEEQKVSFLTE